MSKHMRRDGAKATVEHAMDELAPGVTEQLEGKAKAQIGQGQARLGELTGHPEMARAGRKLEAEGKVEEIVGRVKAATASAVEHVKTAAAEAAEHARATGERISETLKR